MENFKIVVTETITGYIKVNAKDEEDALEKATEILECAYFTDVRRAKVIDIENYLEVAD